VTRWTYDKMGRELTRTLPLGQTESFGYDAAGQRTSHTDFNGVTTRYGYDAAGRMDVVDYATDADVITTYTASGQRESVTDGQGTTLYTYTARDQLASVTTPDGQAITYEYDAAGNKTGLHSAALDQALHYDELNRLSDVDNRTLGGAARRNHFEYDEVGNRKLRVAADGSATTYGYDLRNRLRTLTTRSATGLVLFAAVYTVDASGLRTGIAESDATGPTRSVGYDYDGVKRLEAEAIVRPGQVTRIAAYTYDAVGNRIRREMAGVVTTYEVDDNDRLVREIDGGASTIRGYDDNGNTTYKNGVRDTSPMTPSWVDAPHASPRIDAAWLPPSPGSGSFPARVAAARRAERERGAPESGLRRKSPGRRRHAPPSSFPMTGTPGAG
jgi:YD repeat-containing protein